MGKEIWALVLVCILIVGICGHVRVAVVGTVQCWLSDGSQTCHFLSLVALTAPRYDPGRDTELWLRGYEVSASSSHLRFVAVEPGKGSICAGDTGSFKDWIDVFLKTHAFV